MNDNIKYVDDNEDIKKLIELLEYWAENRYELIHISPVEMVLKMYYKEWGNISTIKYNINSNTFRCKNSVKIPRQLKNTKAIRKQLNKIYISDKLNTII